MFQNADVHDKAFDSLMLYASLKGLPMHVFLGPDGEVPPWHGIDVFYYLKRVARDTGDHALKAATFGALYGGTSLMMRRNPCRDVGPMEPDMRQVQRWREQIKGGADYYARELGVDTSKPVRPQKPTRPPTRKLPPV